MELLSQKKGILNYGYFRLTREKERGEWVVGRASSQILGEMSAMAADESILVIRQASYE
jgi:hypothetical protein